MEQYLFSELRAMEERHWWFMARRAILTRLMRKALRSHKPERPVLLDCGCGTGGMLRFLLHEFEAFGTDGSVVALQQIGAESSGRLSCADLSRGLPFRDNSFDGIFLVEVLEHIQDELEALREIMRILKPGGALVLTVPPFQCLWTHRDASHGHIRRYRAGRAARLLRDAGADIIRVSYWTAFLFPLAAAIRIWQGRFHAAGEEDLFVPPNFLNSLFYRITLAEGLVIPWLPLPFGISVVAVARKK